MKFFTSRRAVVGAAAVGLVGASLAVASSNPATASPRPNIVLILADDLGYDQTSLYGRSGAIDTPNIDAIGHDGVRATQGYVAAPVCSPSRSAIMTGREPARVGADSNDLTRSRPERMPTDTIAKKLPRQYTSMAIGKWDLAGSRPYDGKHLPKAMGFDDFYGFLGGEYSYCPLGAGKSKLKSYDHATHTYKDRTSKKYVTDEFTGQAVNYIDSHAAKSQANPFFLYLAYNAPHDPLQTPTTCHGGKQTKRERFAEMVQRMDQGIGKVRQALQKKGIAKNTLVVFLSDNGQQHDYYTGPTRGGKYDLFEGAVKIPFAFTWPEALPSGVTYREPISSLDLRPTILAAAGSAGSASPPGVPGVNLRPYLNGEKPGSPNPSLSWRYVVDNHASGKGSVLVAQRSGDYKWIRRTTPRLSPESGPEMYNYLFNVDTNPHEAKSGNLWPNAGKSGPLLKAFQRWDSANPIVESFMNPRSSKGRREDKPDGFIEAHGGWTVVKTGSNNKEYEGTSDGPSGRSMVEGSYFTDVKASTSVRLEDPGQAGLIVRGSGAAQKVSGYVAAITTSNKPCAGSAPKPGSHGPARSGDGKGKAKAKGDGMAKEDGDGGVVLLRVVDGKVQNVACRTLSVKTGKTYYLTVRAKGPTLSVDLDGKQRLKWSDKSAPKYSGGRIGFRVVSVTKKKDARAYFGRLNAASCSQTCS